MKSHDLQNGEIASFILAIVSVFIGTHLILSFIGFVPTEVSAFNNQVAQAVHSLHTIEYERDIERIEKEKKEQSDQISKDASLPEAPHDMPSQQGEKPQRIVIDEIGIDTEISNPTTTSLSALNAALNENPVRYPNSGRINSRRPMFIFGHSSRLPVVQNEAYKSFNGLDELSVGDKITIHGTSTTNSYMVKSANVVEKDEGFVSFSPNKKVDLTISTCSTFGSKENRTIVRAKKI